MNFISQHRKVFMGIVFLLGLVVIIILLTFTPADRSLLLGSARSIEVDGISRTFRVYQTKQTDEPTTVIFALHGLGGDSRQIAYYSALHNDLRENTVLVYPDAIKPRNKGERPGWNADFCCGSGWKNKIDDTKFIETLIDTFIEQYKPKDAKVLLTGFSNGAIFAHKLASELPNKIAGFAAVSGSIGVNGNQYTPSKPVPALLIHGEQDKIIKFGGGATVSEPDFDWKPFSVSVAAWEENNKCSSSTIDESESRLETTYQNCEAPLITQVNKKDGHKWPDWRLFNFWNKHSTGSQYILNFLYSL